ncbi:ankyrin repeat domain-containing protein [Brachyspira hampsonii]|uniref:ankyrin repeat domain-containing protein n=1 Tax=Brachyspira hampsonii TaxID=1287055 RepID=UPI001CA5D471|nr:ankyrin repeat domain-containing protein [Brachyspira hampsonii]MBW5390753.1 ankyrin repeat domain-containing protein [Brachyspira hampsonii]
MKITKILITIIFSLALFNSFGFSQYNNDEKTLIEACKKGDLETAKKLIRTGTDVNTKDDKRVSALMYAVKSGNLDLIKELVRFGADIGYYYGSSDDRGKSVNIDIAFFAIENGNNDIIEYLLSKGANPNDFLFFAIYKNDINRVKEFIKKGADANYYLPYASERGNVAIMQELIKAGADDFNNSLRRAIFEYIYQDIDNSEAIIELIKRNADINMTLSVDISETDNYSYYIQVPIFFYAIQTKNYNIVKAFLDKGVKLEGTNRYNQTVIMAAIITNNADIVREILKKDKSLLEEDIENETVLTWAIKNHRGFRYNDNYSVDVKVIDALLEAGADYNAKNSDGKNALMTAASEGREDIIELLEKYGA